MSSSCSGVFTAEVAAAVIEKTVNSSGCGLYMNLLSERCHDTCSETVLFHRLSSIRMNKLFKKTTFRRHDLCTHPAKEINPRAQQAIHDHWKWVNEWVGKFKPAPHVFGDLLGKIPDGFINKSNDFESRRASIDSAPISSTQLCVTHGGHCSVLKIVDLDCSGLPCEDNSRANHKRKYLHGRFGDCYLVWSKFHRFMRTPLIILENTPDPLNCHSVRLFRLFHRVTLILLILLHEVCHYEINSLKKDFNLALYYVSKPIILSIHIHPSSSGPELARCLRTSRFPRFRSFLVMSTGCCSCGWIHAMQATLGLRGHGHTCFSTIFKSWSML